MSELREALNLPIIGGEIVASHHPGAYDKKHRWRWEIIFIFNGPDARYKPAVAHIGPGDIMKLRSALEVAYEKMVQLQKQSFSGTFSKTIGPLYNPTVELKAEGNSVYVNFWVSSNTWRFSRMLNIETLKIVIERLQTIEEQGERMIETLKTII